MPGEFRKADLLKNFCCNLLAFPSRNTPDLQAKINIVPHGLPRKECRLLKDDATVGTRFENRLTVHTDLARLRRLKAGNRADQAGLSATRRSEDRKKIARASSERESFCKAITALDPWPKASVTSFKSTAPLIVSPRSCCQGISRLPSHRTSALDAIPSRPMTSIPTTISG